jgi:hypothetical protein
MWGKCGFHHEKWALIVDLCYGTVGFLHFFVASQKILVHSMPRFKAEVASGNFPRGKWWIFQQAMFDYQRVCGDIHEIFSRE